MRVKRRIQFGLLTLLAVVTALGVVFAILRPVSVDATLESTNGHTWTYRLNPSHLVADSSRTEVLVRTRKVRKLGPDESGSIGIETLAEHNADETATCLSVPGADIAANSDGLLRIGATEKRSEAEVHIDCSWGESTNSIVLPATTLDGSTHAGSARWERGEMHLVNIWTREGDTQYVHDIVVILKPK
jgi:hypothetical protein